MAKKFKAHMMYKKCKGVMAKTMEQHLKLKKKGYFVIYGLDPQSFQNLAVGLEQIKRYIEQQKEIILYYEKAVK